ncbi:MAG: hypothetical protein AAGC44_13910 [Planctomycetota bacterium]
MTTAEGIGMGEKISNPFIHQGEALVCVGHGSRNTKLPGAEAYRLVPIDWYSERLTDHFFGSYAEWARQDPNGFYHGMIVRYGGGHFVMHGPPVTFVPGQVAQPGLFGQE